MFLEHTLIVKDGQESHLQRIFQFLVDPIIMNIEKMCFDQIDIKKALHFRIERVQRGTRY